MDSVNDEVELLSASIAPSGKTRSDLPKAVEFIDRFREVVSDPLNLLIERVAEAGYTDGDCVILHNGNRVPFRGDFSYYDKFSEILIINRGVHEPLEEFCFQVVVDKLASTDPVMLELGAYWAHYSMWLQRKRTNAHCYLVEPDAKNLEAGKHNFSLNGYHGEFINAQVGAGKFEIDAFIAERNITKLDILHSDIQGYELEMLDGAKQLFAKESVDYVFVSTHSEDLHFSVMERLRQFSYRIEVSSGFDHHTTSYDGFVLATPPQVQPLFTHFNPLGRKAIANATPLQLVEYLSLVQHSVNS